MIKSKIKENVDVDRIYLIFIFSCLIVSLIFIHGCINFGDRNCNEEIINQKLSPNGKYVAVYMLRNCHITTPVVAHINLRSTEREFRRESDTYEILDGQIFRILDGFYPEFEWLDDEKLKIICKNCLRAPTIHKIEKWKEVEIDYEFPIDAKTENLEIIKPKE